jgi:hypothetical protein
MNGNNKGSIPTPEVSAGGEVPSPALQRLIRILARAAIRKRAVGGCSDRGGGKRETAGWRAAEEAAQVWVRRD